jgi:hypothetical protein
MNFKVTMQLQNFGSDLNRMCSLWMEYADRQKKYARLLKSESVQDQNLPQQQLIFQQRKDLLQQRAELQGRIQGLLSRQNALYTIESYVLDLDWPPNQNYLIAFYEIKHQIIEALLHKIGNNKACKDLLNSWIDFCEQSLSKSSLNQGIQFEPTTWHQFQSLSEKIFFLCLPQ